MTQLVLDIENPSVLPKLKEMLKVFEGVSIASPIRKTRKTAKKFSKEDQEILDGFRDAIREWKEIKSGKKHPVPDDIAMAQLRKELKDEGYEFD